MRFFLATLMLMSATAVQGVALHTALRQPPTMSDQSVNLAGRWRVKFTLPGIGEKNLVFASRSKGSGSFLLVDAGSDDKSAPTSLPAAWSQTTNNRVNFSGEVELPIGTCCRETGTLIFKGKFISKNSISGQAIFVTNTQDEENFNGFRSMVGLFTAIRLPDNSLAQNPCRAEGGIRPRRLVFNRRGLSCRSRRWT